MNSKIKKFSPLILVIGALGAGFLNGLLGAGGGVILYFTLGALYGSDAKENLMLSSASVMFFCLVSLFFYSGGSALTVQNILSVSIPAGLGGLCGAMLLRKLPSNTVKKIFSAVLILGGILMLRR